MKNLARWATKTAITEPGAEALIDPHRQIRRTFGELASRVEALAHVLQDNLAAGRGHRVAALGKNSIEFVELYLACSATGTLLFPLNWRQSVTLNQTSLDGCTPDVVFYDREFEDARSDLEAHAPGARWICWTPGADSEYESLLAATRSTDWRTLPDPEDLLDDPFIAVPTGGTTGTQKCAVHSQRTYGANVIGYLANQRIDDSTIFMMLGQFFHVTGYMPLAHLALGRPVVITNFDARETVRIINTEGVTSFFCIATMLPRLLEVLRADKIATPSVQLVGYGGAPMGVEVIRAASELFDADLIQLWGMSEVPTGTALGPGAHREALAGGNPKLLRSCGKPGLMTEVKIVDPDGNLVPRDGVSVGELCAYGPHNLLSYWGKPEESALILRDGWVHSGDGAAWDEDGYIYIVDRIKSMIISGGENIFPAEIERVIANIPGIAEVSVVGAPDPEWGEVVRAVVAVASGQNVSEAEIVHAVDRELGSYRKPRIVTFVESLPMTPTGKVNLGAVKALPI